MKEPADGHRSEQDRNRRLGSMSGRGKGRGIYMVPYPCWKHFGEVPADWNGYSSSRGRANTG